MKQILIVGGTFDEQAGKVSALIQTIIESISKRADLQVEAYNGGHISLIPKIINEVKNVDIVMWMPNIDNNETKIRNVKEINPKTILISSKRNDNDKYSFAELISKALDMKSNLTIEFSKKSEKVFNMMIFDPLGNKFYDGTDINLMVENLINRALELTTFTRQGTIQLDKLYKHSPPVQKVFFDFAQECADIFHKIIKPPETVTRFLGNMSFRCQSGFPTFRDDEEPNIIYVSKRNVDKSTISSESFVPCILVDNKNMYFGEHKPSVDTPVQLRLYKEFPNVKYMIHAHCYVDDSQNYIEVKNTEKLIPCGALEEVAEIVEAVNNSNYNSTHFVAVNLKGHGCIILSDSSKKLQSLPKSCFVSKFKETENVKHKK